MDLYCGFVKKAWRKGFSPRLKQHITIKGRTALCGAGPLVFIKAVMLNEFCKKCDKIEKELERKLEL